MNFKNSISKLCCLSSIAAVSIIPTKVIASDPSISFQFDYFNFNVDECMQRAEKALVDNHLSFPPDVTRSGTAIFAVGENQIARVAIDCTEASKSGRITFMGGGSNRELVRETVQQVFTSFKGK